MSEDYKPGKFEDGFVLSEKEFSESVTLALILVPYCWVVRWCRAVSRDVSNRIESIESSRVFAARRCGEDMSQIYGFFSALYPIASAVRFGVMYR